MAESHVHQSKPYPNLAKHLEKGERNLPDPAKRTLRCGPWVDGRCQKCGQLDRLDFIEEFGDD
jgi:hypothetical protein